MRDPIQFVSLKDIVLTVLVLLTFGCSDSTGPEDPAGPGPGPGPGGGGSGPAASVVIEPGAVLLTAAGETMQLEAKVYDAAGVPVQTTVTWRSNDPGTVSVSGGGLATATAGLGSAQITAVAGGVESEPALALVARPTSGVVLIQDSLIVTDPVAVDPNADYGPGWRYRIRVTGDAPEAGQLVMGTGGRSLAGRVVGATAQGAETELTVELVALSQLFADLQIDETIPLVEMETGTGGSSWRAPEPGWGPAGFEAADTEFKLGRFECTASGEVPELDLPSPTLDIDPDLSLALGYANGLEKYAVVGSITADFAYKPVFKATFEGEVGCETVLTTATLALGGPLAWFFGLQVPLGVGFGLDGKLEIAEVGFDVLAHVGATAELGLLCPAAGGTCTGLTSFETERDFDFELIAPDPDEQFKVELGAKGFLFARPSVGTRFSASTQFAFLEATAGLKQSVDLATATRQVKETDYASGFALQGLVDVGPGKDLTSAIEKLERLLGTDLDVSQLTLVAIDDTLAESPKGTFTITPASVEPGNDMGLGDMATFTVELDPVTYLGIEAVDRVEILWKKDDGNGGFTLEPGRPGCTDIPASPGQTAFTCQTDFLEEHAGKQTFYAFVHAKMFGVPIPLPVEIADDGRAAVTVGGQIEGLGLQYPRGISYDGEAVFGAGKTANDYPLLLWRSGEGLIEVANGQDSGDPDSGGISSDGLVIVGNLESDDEHIRGQGFKWVNGTRTPIEGMNIASAVSGDGNLIVGTVWKFDDNDVGGGDWHITTSTGQQLGRGLVYASDTTGTVLVGFGRDGSDEPYLATIWRNGSRTQFGVGRTSDMSPDGTWAVGWSDGMAFRHQAGVGLAQLWNGFALSVSRDGGIVVGAASGVPVLWTEWVGMRPLLGVLEVECGYDLKGWTLATVKYISSDGTVIVGEGLNPEGELEAWRAPLCAAVKTRPESS